MTTRAARVRWGALVLSVGAVAAAAGCGGGATGGSTTRTETSTSRASEFTTGQVQKMIARSIRPMLAANLGPGYTLRVRCAVSGAGFRCVYRAFAPSGKPVPGQRVVYSVSCDPRCSWIPIG